MRVYFFAGERPSEGLINLRNALRDEGHACLRLRAQGSQFTARRDRVIINWGCTDNEVHRLSNGGVSNVLNGVTAITNAVNKRNTFDRFTREGIPCPPAFLAYEAAVNALMATRCRIYARTKLTGHSGDGIIMMLRQDDPAINQNMGNVPVVVFDRDGGVFSGAGDHIRALANCNLFTLGRIGKRTEYRVHTFGGQVIHRSIKLRRNREDGQGERNPTLVRNVNNGWVYGNTEGVPAQVDELAVRSVAALGLDFGAVDILYYDGDQPEALALEVNTAPGLSPDSSALHAYRDAIIRLIQNEKQTTKVCPNCGNTRLVLLGTLNLKHCTDCHTDIPWYVENNEPVIYGGSR